MNAIALQPLALMSTAESLDQPLLQITAPLPAWLLAAGEDVRVEYTRQLIAYHTCASKLEAHLSEVLPSFEDFVRDQVAARIKTDLGVDIDPDVVTIDLPKRVWRDYDIDPQYGRVKSYSAPWIASTERELSSLSELARRNFHADDEQMARRLEFAQVELDGPQVTTGLTAAWLHAVIPQLDVAQGYRARLREVFRVSSMVSEQEQRQADLLLAPYERQIQLQAFCEFARKRLTEEGYRMLTLAAQARCKAETDAAHLEMNWLQFKPGTAVNGDQESLTLRGLCAIRDQVTGHALIYLPDAPVDIGLIEASDLALALSRLIDTLIGKPVLIDYLAERTLDSQNKMRHVSYINQALARGFHGFFRTVPALDLQLAAQQLHTRAWALHQMTQGRARSKFDLDRERNWQQNQTFLMYFRAMLGALPGIGTLVSLHEGWESGHGAAKAFDEGRLDDGLLAAGAVALSMLDVVLSIVPGAASICVLSRLARRSASFRPVASVARQHVLKPFEGYEVQASLSGALPQSGQDIGTVLKDGQLWIQRENRVYAVYRRRGEQTLRLKKTAVHGYEPPVRFEDGTWVYHSDVGLKGGIGSTIAETIIAKAHLDPAFKNRQARQLLDRYEFPPDSQRRMELDVAVHYEKHRVFPGWAEAYRRPEKAVDDSPQPGPSGVKRKDPPTADSQSIAAPQAPSAILAAPSSRADGWKSWARALVDADAVERVRVQPPIFRIAGEQGSDFIEMHGSRYDILPCGASQHPTIVFLKNPTMLEDSFSGLNETIRRNRYDQPIMASFQDGQWTVHGPLFKLKIQYLVEQARPGMTPATNRILAEKIFERADYAHSGLTASRLINMRATLNAWQQGQLSPLANLNDPLLMLEGTRMYRLGTMRPSLSLSYGPSLQPFKRLDFTAKDPSLVSLLAAATSGAQEGGKKTMREFMSALITHAGYTAVFTEEPVLQVRSMLLFQRPGQEQLYMFYMRRFSSSRPEFWVSTPESAIPMSNRWIDEWVAAYPQALNVLKDARSQGRLVKLIGGIKVSSTTDAGTQVFVQRIADDF